MCILNLKSFKNISEAIDETALKSYHADLLEMLADYQKIFVKAVIAWANNNKEAIGTKAIITDAQLYSFISDEKKSENYSASVPYIWSLLFSDTLRTTKDLSEFGLSVEEIDSVKSVIVGNWEPIKNIIESNADPINPINNNSSKGEQQPQKNAD